MNRWRASEHLAKGVLVLFAGVVAATAAMAWRNTHRLQVNDAAVTHSWQVLNAIERLLATLKDVETGQRGYLLTESPRVRDTGRGIASEMLARVFDLFMQAPDASRQPGGLGIGLALVKRLSSCTAGQSSR